MGHRWNLAGDGDNGDAVKHGVRKAADEVGGSGTGGGDADAGKARGAGIALGGENAALLVAGEDVLDDVGAGEGLVDLHGGAARVSEDVGDALALQGLHEDIGAFAGLVGAKSGSEGLGGGWSGDG